MDSTTILAGISILVNVLIGLYVGHLKSYIERKGENLADKEDLCELTEIVEKVKHDFERDREVLRAELGVITNKKNILFGEAKESIIDFSSALNIWLWDALRVPITEYSFSNYEDIDLRVTKIKAAYNQVQVAMSRVELTVTDHELVMTAYSTISEVLKLDGFVQLQLFSLKRLLVHERTLVDTFLRGDFKLRDTPKEIADFFRQDAKENREEKDALVEKFLPQHSELFKAATGSRAKFIAHSKSFLNTL